MHLKKYIWGRAHIWTPPPNIYTMVTPLVLHIYYNILLMRVFTDIKGKTYAVN